VIHQGFGQANIVGVDVNDVRFRIERGSSPLPSAIEAGKHESVFVYADGDELPIVTYLMKALHRPLMRLRRAIGEHVFRDLLAREGRRFGGERLFGRRHFSRDIAGQILVIFDGEERGSVDAIE
jgi:hypothetical protein